MKIDGEDTRDARGVTADVALIHELASRIVIVSLLRAWITV